MEEKIINYLKVGFFLLLFISFTYATAYDIAQDQDTNEYNTNDYKELTESAIGEGLLVTAKNPDWIFISIVLAMIGGSIVGLIIWATGK